MSFADHVPDDRRNGMSASPYDALEAAVQELKRAVEDIEAKQERNDGREVSAAVVSRSAR